MVDIGVILTTDGNRCFIDHMQIRTVAVRHYGREDSRWMTRILELMNVCATTWKLQEHLVIGSAGMVLRAPVVYLEKVLLELKVFIVFRLIQDVLNLLAT